LRDTFWPKEKDNALLKWSLHLLNTHRTQTKDKLHTLNLKIIPSSNLARSLWPLWTGVFGLYRSLRVWISESPGMIKAKLKIHLNSVATGHLMIKAIQLIKARTRTAIMKMIK
jgi:hypothetical protein